MKFLIAVLASLVFLPHASSAPVAYNRPIPYSVGALDTSEPPSEADTFVYHQVFSTLFTFSDGELRGDLIERWKVLDFGRKFELEIRKASFHDGSDVTATDVKYSLERLKKAKSYIANLFAPLTSIEVLGKRLIRITLKRPNSNVLVRLADPSASILKLEESSSKLNGSGPFRIGERTSNAITLFRNKDFYGKISEIEVLKIETASKDEAISGFKQNKFDDLFHYNLGVTEQAALKPQCQIFNERLPMVRFLVVKANSSSALSSARLRACVNAFLNRQAIADALDKEQKLLESVLPRFILGASLLEKYDSPACAAEDLFQLQKQTKKNPIKIAVTASSEAAIGVISKSMDAKNISYRLVRAGNIAEYLEMIGRPGIDLYIGRYTARTPESESFLHAFSGPKAFWPVGLRSNELSKLTSRVEELEDRQSRARTAAEIFNLYAREQVLVPIQQFEFRGCANLKWDGIKIPEVGFIYQDLNIVRPRKI